MGSQRWCWLNWRHSLCSEIRPEFRCRHQEMAYDVRCSPKPGLLDRDHDSGLPKALSADRFLGQRGQKHLLYALLRKQSQYKPEIRQEQQHCRHIRQICLLVYRFFPRRVRHWSRPYENVGCDKPLSSCSHIFGFVRHPSCNYAYFNESRGWNILA